MSWGKHFLEAATLIVAAVVCALVANAFASRERKLVVISRYSSTPARPNMAAPTPRPAPVEAPAPAPAPSGKQSPPAVSTQATQQPGNTATKQPSNPAPQQPNDRFPPHPDKAYVEIHHGDVAWLHANGALFLDARRTSVYDEGHIAGARPFPVWESDIDDRVNQLYAERSDPKEQNRPIVVYCSGGDCEDSHMLAQKLWGIQFNNLYVYKDGFPDWKSHGGEVRVGGDP